MSSRKSIAILGGGIGGLSTAYYLVENSLKHKINIGKIYLFEEKSRVGGWIQTHHFESSYQDHFHELGPRTISLNSYAGFHVLSLINSLKLSDQIISIPYGTSSLRKRYIAIDNQLRLIPNKLTDLFLYKKPFKPFLLYGIKDLLLPSIKIGSNDDISVHDFFNYRFGPEVTNYIVDALCIGISGGDSKILSMKSFFPNLFQKEQMFGSILKGMLKGNNENLKDFKEDDLVQKSIQEKWAICSFEKGMETLTARLMTVLNDNYGVKICLNSKVNNLHFEKDQIIIEVLQKENKMNIAVDHVFSSIPAIKLSSLLSKKHDQLKKNLSLIKPVHMAVVCLQFKNRIIPPEKGFGFLVPSCENSDILGVTFDSCIFPSECTKVTVMLGGYLFEKLFGQPEQVNDNQLIDISLKALKNYLNINEMPIRFHVAIHQDCIPQYTVGHKNRLRIIEDEIKNLNLSLVGASYYGLSVSEIILNAKIQANRWIQEKQYSKK